MSCCGRGGSWFGNCGSGDDANASHMWSEGIWACNIRLTHTVVGQNLRAPKPRQDTSSDDASMGTDSTAVIATGRMFAPIPANSGKMSTPAVDLTEITASLNTSMVVSVRMSEAYDNNITTYKASAAKNAKTVYNLKSMPTPKSTASHASQTIKTRANDTSRPLDTSTDITWMDSDLTDISMKTSSHFSATISLTSREWAKFLHIGLQISIMATIAYW